MATKKTAKKSTKKPTRAEIEAEHREFALESLQMAATLRSEVGSDESATLALAELAMDFGMDEEELQEVLNAAKEGAKTFGALEPALLVELAEMAAAHELGSDEVRGVLLTAHEIGSDVLASTGFNIGVAVALACSMATAYGDAQESEGEVDFDTFRASFRESLVDAVEQAKSIFGPSVKAETIIAVLDVLADVSDYEE